MRIAKVLVANRGEIAVRVIRACREQGIVSVAVFSAADREALHVQMADEAAVRAAARAIGYPLMIKASMGGGGKGMRAVHAESELIAALGLAQSEAAYSFGDGAVYLERLLLEPRHIELQVLADAHGHVVHLGERECSIQRRHQKLVEESPSPFVDAAMRGHLGEAACRIAKAAGYPSGGTVQFLG